MKNTNIPNIEVMNEETKNEIENRLKPKTWHNKLLLKEFYTPPEKRYVLKKNLAFGEPIIKEQNSAIGRTAADRKIKVNVPIPAGHEVNKINYGATNAGTSYTTGMKHISCDFAKFSINIPILEDYLHEATMTKKIEEAGEMHHAHQEKLIIEKLVNPITGIEKIYPGGISNVAGVSAAAGNDGNLTLAMFQQAIHRFRTNKTQTRTGEKLSNPIPGYKNSKNYLAIITHKQANALLEDPAFEKLFNKTERGVLEEFRNFDLISMYLGIKFEISNVEIIVKGSESTEAQAAIVCGGTEILLQVQSSRSDYELGVHFEENKPLGSDSANIANLVGARIVAKWYSGFVVPDPDKIKLLCYKKEA